MCEFEKQLGDKNPYRKPPTSLAEKGIKINDAWEKAIASCTERVEGIFQTVITVLQHIITGIEQMLNAVQT